MISEETITELTSLLAESNKIYLKKEELSKTIQKESNAKKVRLINIDNSSYNIYLTYTGEKEDINDIAKQLGYILEHTFKSGDNYTYLLTIN